ncbi:hypothetical protein ABW20_dc0108207 [Dactylellina cionopaga]|nr:hypothetical protein ABW20_dc0108207 [Dactylellina cionopaga]
MATSTSHSSFLFDSTYQPSLVGGRLNATSWLSSLPPDLEYINEKFDDTFFDFLEFSSGSQDSARSLAICDSSTFGLAPFSAVTIPIPSLQKTVDPSTIEVRHGISTLLNPQVSDAITPSHLDQGLAFPRTAAVADKDQATSNLPASPVAPQPPAVEQAPQQNRMRKQSRTYDCAECSYTSSNLKTLGNHMRDDHRLQGFKCSDCDTRVTRHDNLDSHRKFCKGRPKAKRPATQPTSPPVTVRPQKRHRRVNLRTLQSTLSSSAMGLPPAQAQTSSSSNSGDSLHILPVTLPKNSNSVLQPCDIPDRSRLSDINGSLATSASIVDSPQSASDLVAENASLKDSLARTKVELDMWKDAYLRLMLSLGVKS